MTVNITIVAFNRLALTRICLESLFALTTGEFAVNVVDNASTDGTREYLRGCASRWPRLQAHFLARNMGVSVAANYGWAAAAAEYYVKLDNDVEILQPEWLTRLVELAGANPDVGMAAHQLCARHAPRRVRLASGASFLQYPTAGGGCVLIPRRVHERLGFWNEDYGLYGFEDLEYGERVCRAGWKAGYADSSGMVRHLGYEREVSAGYEQRKEASVESGVSGKKLYFINKFLFEQGIRSACVPRKYLPVPDTDPMRFAVNPAYKPILRLQRHVLRSVRYAEEGDSITLDLSDCRTGL